MGVVIAYAASAYVLEVTPISMKPVVSFVLLSGYAIISLEELVPADLFCIDDCVNPFTEFVACSVGFVKAVQFDPFRVSVLATFPLFIAVPHVPLHNAISLSTDVQGQVIPPLDGRVEISAFLLTPHWTIGIKSVPTGVPVGNAEIVESAIVILLHD